MSEQLRAFVSDDGISFEGINEEYRFVLPQTLGIQPASNVTLHYIDKFLKKGRSAMQTETKKRKYYHVNEIVLIKRLNIRGTVKELDVQPEKRIYTAKVQYVDLDGRVVHEHFNLWEIDKVEMEYNERFNRRERRERRERKTLQIKVKYFDGEMADLHKMEVGDWIDLRSAETVTLTKGQFVTLPLGIAMELPKGFEAHIAPRSSSFKHFGTIQTNGVGVVDESYCGDNDQWFVPLLAMRDTVINKGDRICQFRIMRKMDRVELVTVDHLGNADRGGHGSTGKN